MNLFERKGRRLGHRTQLVIFSREGLIQDSCHSLVDLRTALNRNLFEQYPVLASLQPWLADLPSVGRPMSLPGVNFDWQGRRGIYDFEFWADPNLPQLIEWLITDQTEWYEHLRQVQQQRNELWLKVSD